ncbi:MAG: HAMP domain-containing sensor histidine kinase [Phototrophicaceae bacterium]
MTDQPNYDKLLLPIADVTASVETLLDGAFGNLMGDQRESLKRVYAAAWGLHTLLLDIVTNIGIENIAKRSYLPQKFDEYLNPFVTDSMNLIQGLDGPLNEEQHVSVEFIHATGGLLRHYVDNLWLYSQLNNDLYRLDKQFTKMETIVNPMQWSVTTNPVELELLIPEALPPVQVDATLMQAVIAQVVENAINNTHEGIIRVSVSLEDRMMLITVHDTGGGIPEMYLQDIFIPYFQVNPDQLGLGLGLSIAQKGLLLHQGVLTVEANKQETTVKMRFPI